MRPSAIVILTSQVELFPQRYQTAKSHFNSSGTRQVRILVDFGTGRIVPKFLKEVLEANLELIQCPRFLLSGTTLSTKFHCC